MKVTSIKTERITETAMIVTILGERLTKQWYEQLPLTGILVRDEDTKELTRELTGEPLGWVNMHTPECAKARQHCHVLMVVDGDLMLGIEEFPSVETIGHIMARKLEDGEDELTVNGDAIGLITLGQIYI